MLTVCTGCNLCGARGTYVHVGFVNPVRDRGDTGFVKPVRDRGDTHSVNPVRDRGGTGFVNPTTDPGQRPGRPTKRSYLSSSGWI